MEQKNTRSAAEVYASMEESDTAAMLATLKRLAPTAEAASPPVSPYHTRAFEKGVFGEPSKIFEEVEEFRDAVAQSSPVLELCELSDIIGAIAGYAKKRYNITLADLIKMTDANTRAFENGHRS